MIDRTEEILTALRRDPQLNLREQNGYLRGTCPACQKKEVFVKIAEPHVLKCGRENNCGHTEKTFERYSDLFENLADKFPATHENPNASADAYMVNNRGFDLAKVAGTYKQGIYKLRTGESVPTIRFYLTENLYWERLINASDVAKNGGKKAHFPYGTSYKGKAWVPPTTTFDNGSKVYICEGIFKAQAFVHIGKQAISAMSCGNFPEEIISANSGKNITWVVAIDNDQAGRKSAVRFSGLIKDMGEMALVAIPHGKEDWDDLYRVNKLTDKYLSDCFWRGKYEMAQTAWHKAFWYWARTKKNYNIFPFKNKLWRFKIDASKIEDQDIIIRDMSPLWTGTSDMEYIYSQYASEANIDDISNSLPEYLYLQKNPITNNQAHVFRIKSTKINKAGKEFTREDIFKFCGSALRSPSSFHENLLKYAEGSTFYGSQGDLKFLHDKWLGPTQKNVKCVDFCGYDADSKTYIFPDFGFSDGRHIEKTSDDYIELKNELVKTDANIDFQYNSKFDPSWLPIWQKAYGDQSIALIGWWVGSLFFNQLIKSELKAFPFMEYTGDAGAGKSTQVSFLWRCMGRDYEGFDPSKSTGAGWMRKFMEVSNMPICLLEACSEDPTQKKGFNFNDLKSIINGGSLRVTGVKTMGNEVKEEPVKSPVLITQNPTVEGDKATLSRLIHIHCTTDHHSEETAKAYDKLVSMEIEDLCGLLPAILRKEKEIVEGIIQKTKEINAVYRQGKKMEQRISKFHATVAACVWQLQKVFGKENISDETCTNVQHLIYNRALDRQKRYGGDSEAIEEFWGTYDYLIGLWDSETKNLNHSQSDDLIAINLNQFASTCAKKFQPCPPIGVLKKLLPDSRSNAFIESKIIKSDKTGKSTRCFIFKKGKK